MLMAKSSGSTTMLQGEEKVLEVVDKNTQASPGSSPAQHSLTSKTPVAQPCCLFLAILRQIFLWLHSWRCMHGGQPVW